MRRKLEKKLLAWKDKQERSPLLIRGARQVGKSFLVESFGKQNFESCVTVNFEFQPQLKECFKTFDPQEIVNKIQLMLGVRIKEGETLLFLDEIQDCPNAIMSMRYFKEKKPGLHVIGAGSLLEFALQSSNFKMPVGRIQFLHLAPLSFSEFLTAAGNEQLESHLANVSFNNPLDKIIHDKLLELIRLYLILGGMPAVLKEYFLNKDLASCQNIQTGLLQTYRSDFGKYAKLSQHQYLQKVFDATPRLVGQRIKYVNIDPEIKSRELKNALALLVLSGVITPVYLTKASGLPLGAQTDEKKFKLIFLDIGLMQNSCGLQSQLSVEPDFMQINSGAVAEQLIGQELRAYADQYQPSQLYFWARDKKSSSAEIDYIINRGANILPLEVKAGKTGRLKSLKLFLAEKKSPLGIRVSQDQLSYYDNVLSVPLYLIAELPRLIDAVIKK